MVVNGVITVESLGALRTPINSLPVLISNPPVTTKGVFLSPPIVKLPSDPESTLVSPTSNKLFPLASRNTVEPLR